MNAPVFVFIVTLILIIRPSPLLMVVYSVDSPAGRLRRLSQHNELQAAQGETRASYGLRGWDHCVLCTEMMRPSGVSAAMCEGLLQVPGVSVRSTR
ncbi:unnamed protein product [Arctogadus glacialis]